ncbi:MAG: CAP domain-containing protein [Chloroflexota bacterium]
MVNKLIKVLPVLLIIVLLTMVGCSRSVSQQEYDNVQKELSDLKSQVADLQAKLDKAMAIETQYRDLNAQHEELKRQYAAQVDGMQRVQTSFDDLNTRYEKLNKEFQDLKIQYEAVTQGMTVFSEDEINQAIFTLVNAERKKAGVPALVWGTNIDDVALQNSREMASLGKYHYSTTGGLYQDVFWAVRYGSVDQIANAALITWKVDDYGYKNVIINGVSTYGAVGTYKSGEIYYITFMASVFR